MDALIFSCGTGGGHNSAANAVKQELLRRGHRVTMLDPYSLSNTRVGSLINQSYINLVKKAPRLFGLVYQLGNLYRRLPVHSPVYHINHRMALPVQRFLEEGNFDLIIMPHIFPGEILTNMRDHGICFFNYLVFFVIYTEGFVNVKMGYASAIAYTLFAIIMVITLIQFVLQKKWVNYD